MGHMNEQSISQYDKGFDDRESKLKKLISEPFDLNNKEQRSALKQYINDFETHVHLMLVYQGLAEGGKLWGIFRAFTFIVPVHDYISFLFTCSLYTGVFGLAVEWFSRSDFRTHRKEMEALYNWCLKDGQALYNSKIDNTTKLGEPDIQLLIKLLAPLCEVDFMMAWPRETTQPIESQDGVINTAQRVGSSVLSFFWGSGKQEINQEVIKELKKNVESKNFALNPYSGFEKARVYFMSNPYFRNLVSEKAEGYTSYVKGFIPSGLLESKKFN